VIIIVVIVVMLIRRWKKKHPREIKGENILRAEKDIKVIEPEQFKEEFIVDKEYTDDKPKYVQRVVTKKKSTSKKKR
ncbi:MAG TPA: hypothetical protein VJ903_05755, partial [Clostridia bacterium]|nr:hypothetical protein [Clostridia bacterium]